ncbi:hypothetical protein EIN_129210 [Entamoeba invadens IP1]|uniref:Uncharacterized protein n=1 Tax=Entamoeba invadens IP1 TaxID=370355 RepID=L7FNB1_ENTIV|nr:hypothetical protein EIN_129210 [Entamoeba invadens IP1]ELP91581.1 hypothetical protein EIN_129210 [Entamoeba invadens IP1]|eukprot:XP_004258352.1 hypothetical protein EIN_129210 [Entamoeba invadens IP1]
MIANDVKVEFKDISRSPLVSCFQQNREYLDEDIHSGEFTQEVIERDASLQTATSMKISQKLTDENKTITYTDMGEIINEQSAKHLSDVVVKMDHSVDEEDLGHTLDMGSSFEKMDESEDVSFDCENGEKNIISKNQSESPQAEPIKPKDSQQNSPEKINKLETIIEEQIKESSDEYGDTLETLEPLIEEDDDGMMQNISKQLLDSQEVKNVQVCILKDVDNEPLNTTKEESNPVVYCKAITKDVTRDLQTEQEIAELNDILNERASIQLYNTQKREDEQDINIQMKSIEEITKEEEQMNVEDLENTDTSRDTIKTFKENDKIGNNEDPKDLFEQFETLSQDLQSLYLTLFGRVGLMKNTLLVGNVNVPTPFEFLRIVEKGKKKENMVNFINKMKDLEELVSYLKMVCKMVNLDWEVGRKKFDLSSFENGKKSVLEYLIKNNL